MQRAVVLQLAATPLHDTIQNGLQASGYQLPRTTQRQKGIERFVQFIRVIHLVINRSATIYVNSDLRA